MKTRTIYKIGDRTDAYIVGERLSLRYTIYWTIISVKYTFQTNKTAIKLQLQ